MTRFFLACSAMFLCIAVATQTLAAGPETAAAQEATNYIRTLQGADGGFPDFATTSTPSATLDAVFAFAAAGIDPRTVTNGGTGPDDYLATQAAAYSSTPGGAAKLVAALAAMDLDPTAFGGIDPLALMEANYDPATGKYGDEVFAQALFMLAERSLERTVPAASATYLVSLQKPDGGWEFCCGLRTDTNTTALAVRALVAAGTPATDPALMSAVAYLRANQTADGGFAFTAPFESDANSTAYVIQAIVALGQSAEAGGPWDLGGSANPLTKLLSFQNPTTGALIAFGSDSAFATYQGVPGLMLAAFPEQANPDDFTATPVASSTSTASITSTPTATFTATRTHTSTPTRTATVASTTATPVPAGSSPTAVSTVLGTTARPPQAAPVSALPQTGDGSTDGRDGVATALALSGVALLLAGITGLRRRRAE